MGPYQNLWIFSDLHLTDFDSDFARAFLRALEEPNGVGDAVVFAGDIFEVLVGNSAYFFKKYALFFVAVNRLVQKGVAVFYLEGNHDFHLRGLFSAAVVFPGDSVQLRLVAQNRSFRTIHIEHGDLIDREDRGYLKLRALFRSSPVRWLSRWLPGRMIEGLGSGISRESTQKIQDLPESWDESRRHRLRSIFRAGAEAIHKKGVDFIVFGHCHDLDDFGGYYWNMGFPPIHRQFIVYQSAGPEDETAKETLHRRNFL